MLTKAESLDLLSTIQQLENEMDHLEELHATAVDRVEKHAWVVARQLLTQPLQAALIAGVTLHSDIKKWNYCFQQQVDVEFEYISSSGKCAFAAYDFDNDYSGPQLLLFPVSLLHRTDWQAQLSTPELAGVKA